MSIQSTLWIHLFHLYLLKEPTRAAGSSGSFDVCFPNNRDTFSSTHSNDNSMPAKRWNTAPPLPLYWISIQIKVQWISPIISMNMPPTNKHTPTIICGEKYFQFFPKEHIFCLALGARLLTYTIMLHYHDGCSFCTQGHRSHFAPMILTQPARFAHLNLW